jgi:hypothetical protein
VAFSRNCAHVTPRAKNSLALGPCATTGLPESEISERQSHPAAKRKAPNREADARTETATDGSLI